MCSYRIYNCEKYHYLRWNRGAWHSIHNIHQTFIAPCIRCTNHLCDVCRLIDVNPHFTAPGCQYYFKITSCWTIVRSKKYEPLLATVTPQWTIIPRWVYGRSLIIMARDVIINWPRATHTARIMPLIMVQRRGSMRTVHGFGTEQIGNPASWLVESRNCYSCMMMEYKTHHSGWPRTLLGLMSLFNFLFYFGIPVFQHGASLVVLHNEINMYSYNTNLRSSRIKCTATKIPIYVVGSAQWNKHILFWSTMHKKWTR